MVPVDAQTHSHAHVHSTCGTAFDASSSVSLAVVCAGILVPRRSFGWRTIVAPNDAQVGARSNARKCWWRRLYYCCFCMQRDWCNSRSRLLQLHLLVSLYSRNYSFRFCANLAQSGFKQASTQVSHGGATMAQHCNSKDTFDAPRLSGLRLNPNTRILSFLIRSLIVSRTRLVDLVSGLSVCLVLPRSAWLWR